MISPAALQRLAQVCHAQGIKHLKTEAIELEIDFTIEQRSHHEPKNQSAPQPKPQMDLPLSPEADKANAEAVEKLKGLISTLKMSDEQLMDQLFPTGMPA